MRVLHCCLAAFYIDDAGYQENILPRMHKRQGHEVAIIASTETYLENHQMGYLKPSNYLSNDGIPVSRLPYAKGLPHKLARKLRIYRGLYEAVDEFSPDILFLHDCQFLDISRIAQYAKSNPNVRIYVDGHTDFMNSARTWLSKYILHGLIYRYCAKRIEPYTRKFYGVLPARVDFFHEMYGISREKTDLLVLGADDEKIDFERKDFIRDEIRDELEIKNTDFVVITGGKIDRRKSIHYLMRAILSLESKDTKLIVFGSPTEDMRSEIDELSGDDRIRCIGWVDSDKVYDLFLAADLGVFPGTHSVLWEQAIGTGLPCLFRSWKGMHHVDVGGNCGFLESDREEEIAAKVTELIIDRERLRAMASVAKNKGTVEFAYSAIAKRAIAA